MISKNDILKLAHKATKRSRGYSERKAISPYRDWCIGILIFLSIGVIGGVTNARTYVRYNHLEMEVKSTVAPPKTLDVKDIENAIALYGGRKETFDTLAGNVTLQAIEIVASSTATTSDAANTEEGVAGDTASSTE